MIFLTILKIIGFVLLGILALALLLLLLVLFAPLQYVSKAEGENADIRATATVKWLFGAVSAGIAYADKAAVYRVKIFFVTLLKGEFGKDEAEAAKEVLKEEAAFLKKDKEDAEEDGSSSADADTDEAPKALDPPNRMPPPSEPQSREDVSEEPAGQELSGQEPPLQPEAVQPDRMPAPDRMQAELPDVETAPEENTETAADGGAEDAEHAAESKDEKDTDARSAAREDDTERFSRLEHFKKKLRDVIARIKNILEKIKLIKYIARAPVTKRAIQYLMKQLFNLLNHIKPYMIKGRVRYGLEDCSLTAVLYGLIEATLGFVPMSRVMVVPDFEKTGVSLSKFTVKGRIFMGYMALLALRIITNKDILKVYKTIRRSF